jgi:hypothetical protein
MGDGQRSDEERLTEALDAADKMLTDVGGIAWAAHAEDRRLRNSASGSGPASGHT